MKKFFISFFIAVFAFSTVVYAGNLVKKVYFSPYPILIDGEEYSSETPILQYQDRTYVALREFSEMVNVDVDFLNETIIINTNVEKNSEENEKENEEESIIISIKKEPVEEVKEESVKEEPVKLEDNSPTNETKSNVVYVTKTGKKYHKLSNCNGAEYTAISLSEAIGNGLTPCLRCANAK